jgi:hypothetical protein
MVSKSATDYLLLTRQHYSHPILKKITAFTHSLHHQKIQPGNQKYWCSIFAAHFNNTAAGPALSPQAASMVEDGGYILMTIV